MPLVDNPLATRPGGKLYQDQLYGTKVLSPLAVALIDTPEFQRLAGLKQLGFSDVSYRGARHSRFEHSVGTYFLSRTIMRRIVQNHERLDLEHPGMHLSPKIRLLHPKSGLNKDAVSNMARWRGMAEVVSAAALLHDIGHVPFGHTLEDEFTGLYLRHDSLAGPRFYTMLFDDKNSDLAKVFTEREQWFDLLSNEEVRQLIYVILSWKDKVAPPESFDDILTQQIQREGANGTPRLDRLKNLHDWYEDFSKQGLFHPFMSDIVGNTICADMLDYLARDRLNLGMEVRLHNRLQRYITIRTGTLYPNEGLRVSIMVTRPGRGGQRKDVASTVLSIMRERYEMVERVFYHHKKAAASSMLAFLVELAMGTPREGGSDWKPREDEAVYPAPWQTTIFEESLDNVPHMVHLSDAELIDYLGRIWKAPTHLRKLRRALYSGLRFNRTALYRTLLVVDEDLCNDSRHHVAYLVTQLRGTKSKPSSAGRKQLEEDLREVSKANLGDIIVYCPGESMQSKEIDVRLEISEKRVLPLRILGDFTFRPDVDVLQRYYERLWRMYIFVSPDLFKDGEKCQAVIDKFCSLYGISRERAYKKVRTHKFATLDISEGPSEVPEPLATPKASHKRVAGDRGKDVTTRTPKFRSKSRPLDSGS